MKVPISHNQRQLLIQELALCCLLVTIVAVIVGGAWLYQRMKWQAWERLYQATEKAACPEPKPAIPQSGSLPSPRPTHRRKRSPPHLCPSSRPPKNEVPPVAN